MKRNREKRPRALAAVTLRVGLAAAVIWGVSMFCLTNAVAQLCYDIIYSENAGSASQLNDDTRLSSAIEEDTGVPGYVENRRWQALDNGSSRSFFVRAPEDKLNVLRDKGARLQTAIFFYDADGNVLDESGDFIYFPYVSEPHWQAGLANTQTDGYAKVPLDRTLFSDSEWRFVEELTSSLVFEFRVMRFTGVLEGQVLTPAKIEYVLYDDFTNMVPEDSWSYYDQHVHAAIDDLEIPWHTLWERDAPLPGDAVTLYSTYSQLNLYDSGGSVRYDGEVYESLAALLASIGPREGAGRGQYDEATRHSLLGTFLFDVNFYHDYTGWEYSEQDPSPPLRFYMVSAVYASPLRIAAGELRTVYIVTFLLAALCVLLLRKALKRHLIAPVQKVNQGISEGWTNVFYGERTPPSWRESHELREHYGATQSTLRKNKSELTRLNTALEYAKTAEQNRRQMTSAIAHEFKTPLAVIHSYAEGLKEHINEGKREKYIDVILSEAEHLDDMVLELLDLSRLEAGKVKLALEEFSLSELARSVFARLEMAARTKDLDIEFDFPGNCTVTADESRIRQVIENFAANAVKYTPAGGHIRVGVFPARAGLTFSVENESPPLSKEALEKVWDTFYQADGSRTGTGTGLGLAIAKNIVELHGGTCSAYNTATGVVFQFTI